MHDGYVSSSPFTFATAVMPRSIGRSPYWDISESWQSPNGQPPLGSECYVIVSV